MSRDRGCIFCGVDPDGDRQILACRLIQGSGSRGCCVSGERDLTRNEIQSQGCVWREGGRAVVGDVVNMEMAKTDHIYILHFKAAY